MKNGKRTYFVVGICCLATFVLWTVLICLIDVRAIGPNGSTVGFATLNAFVHDLTGVHMSLYTVTDWFGLIPLGFVGGFACLGLIQWIRRGRLLAVDRDILILGGFYVVVLVQFVFFETVAINHRPVLIDGVLEASYPSSTTILVCCVMPTAGMQGSTRIRNRRLRCGFSILLIGFTTFMIFLRLISGVHWVTDIIGGGLLSTGLVAIYAAMSERGESIHAPQGESCVMNRAEKHVNQEDRFDLKK